MRHPPPDDKKKKLAEVPQTPGQLTTNKLNNALTSPDGNFPACSPLSIKDTPTDSLSQFCATNLSLAELDAEIERERARFRKADKSENDDGFLYSFLRLLCLYERHSLTRWEAVR